MKSIIPKGFMGEQYTEDVALIFKIKKSLISAKTKFQKVDIIETETYGKILFLDNLLMKCDKDGHIITEMQVHVPMNVGRKKKKILIIGGGEGFSTTEVLKYPWVKHIDMIDIDGEFVEIAKKFYPEKTKSFKDPRVNVIIMEGLEYLRQTKEKYDLILCTPTDPLTISDPLFIGEFYSLVDKCLVDDGVFLTDSYMPYYAYSKVDYAHIYQKMKKQFKMCNCFNICVPTFPGGLFTFIIASKKDDPEKDVRKIPPSLKTRYYNTELHKAAFKLPQFMIDRLNAKDIDSVRKY